MVSSQMRPNKSPSSGAFRKNGVLSGYFHQLWLDTSDALSVPGSGPGTFLNSQSDISAAQTALSHTHTVKGLLFSCSFRHSHAHFLQLSIHGNA